MARYSIILPVRNGGHYVKECVNSILSQTYTDFNLHVLDNCSTDGTTDYIKSIIDERVKIFPAEKPLSIEENWARITFIHKNEYITLIGHDDVLDPNYLQVMEGLVSDHPDASLYQAHFRYINAAGGVIRKCKAMTNRLSEREFMAFFLCNMIDSMGTGFMMRSIDYDRVGGIPLYPNLLFADFALWISLIKKSYMAIAFEETFSFRLHQSTTTTSSDIKFQDAFKTFVQFLSEQKNEENLNKVITRYGVNFIAFYVQGLTHRLLRTPKNKRQGRTVEQLLKDCKRYADELVPGNKFNPLNNYSVKIAKHIDSNPLTRSLFLAFKRLYAKPIFS